MDKYQELKIQFDQFCDSIEETLLFSEKDDIALFWQSCALKIWNSNDMTYSDDYRKAFNTVLEESYTVEQMLTAMACCAIVDRTVNVPAFFENYISEMETWDEIEQNDELDDFFNELNELLVATAFINGDFTIKEARTLDEILETLLAYCKQHSPALSVPIVHFEHKTTDYNEKGYGVDASLLHFSSEERDENEQNGLVDRPISHGAGDLSFHTTLPVDMLKEQEKRFSIAESISLTVKLDGEEGEAFIRLAREAIQKNAPLHLSYAFSMDGAAPDRLQTESRTVKTEERRNDDHNSLMAELDSLIGLETVKRDVHSLMNFIKVSNLRRSRGMKVPTISYHLVFTGNPGTGKTTVARLVAKLYHQMGILSQGQLVEADRSTLVAGYLGQTAIKTQEVIQKAIGGVLFIDEAYSLAGDKEDSYGKEAIETLLKAMEDHRDELVVIVAGYDALMHKFIDSNPGLASRFGKYFQFPDYEPQSLSAIYRLFCEKNGYRLSEEADALLASVSQSMYDSRKEHFGNARDMRNLFERTIHCQANRLAFADLVSDEALITLTESDLRRAMEG